MRALIDPVMRRVRAALLASPARTGQEHANASNGPIVVAGLFRTASGIGESARRCSQALAAERVAHICVDLSSDLNQVDLPPDNQLEPMPAAMAGTLILHVNGPEVAPALHHLRMYGSKRWRVIGCWVWELEAAPDEWRNAVRYLSEIWAPSMFCADAFAELADIPVRVVPYWVKAPRKSSPKTSPRYALTMADGRSSLRRKNPEAAIRVFLEALGDREDWSLVVKTRNLNEAPAEARRLHAVAAGHPRIKFIDASMSDAERWDLIAGSSVLISLHRSEGFGLPVAEALAAGVPVIATGWSAVAEFTPPASLVPYVLENVDDPGGPYAAFRNSRWAAPVERAAVSRLRHLLTESDRNLQEMKNEGSQAYLDALLGSTVAFRTP